MSGRAPDPSTVRISLRRSAERLAGAGIEGHHFESRVLMAAILDCEPADVVLHGARTLTPRQQQDFEALVRRRAAREPLQYILGFTEFYSLRFIVTPAALIPRPETELLVEAVLEEIAPGTPALIADLGTGSGAVAVTLAVHRPDCRVFALDLSADALNLARRNAAGHSVADRIHFRLGSWCAPLLEEGLDSQLDAVAANPPYVTRAESAYLEVEVRDHEPSLALYAEGDAMRPYRDIMAGAARVLRPGGFLALECAPHRAADLKNLLAARGWDQVTVCDDYAGQARMITARNPDGTGSDDGGR